MKAASIIGSMVVTVAMIFYSLGYFKEKRSQLTTLRIMTFYSIGLALDITATILMIMGSGRGMVTFHGFIGYSSLIGMLVDTSILWKHYLKAGPDKIVSRHLHLYSRIAYTWWIIAFITGGTMVAISRMNR
jgi:hypothetical protein